MRRELHHQLWIALTTVAVFFTNLGAVALWDEDEPLYASCAREMLERGDWVVPTFNGEVFPEKPPLTFWLMISAFQLFGVNEFAARCWSALLGCGTALLTYHLGKRLFRPEVGLWAGLIVATSIVFTVSARAATVDSALVFFTTLAMLLFVAGGMTTRDSTTAGPESHSTILALIPHSWLVFAAFYACLGAAVLTKGPIGVALPVMMICLFLLIMNAHGTSDTQRADNGSWVSWLKATASVFAPRSVLQVIWRMRPITAIVVVGIVAVPWFVLVSLRTDGAWLTEFLGEQNLRRALKPMQGHAGPFFYYVPAILIGFFPWSVFLVPSLLTAIGQIRVRRGWRTPTIFVLCWLGVFIALWSIPKTKLPHYVLPAYPALALLTALFVDAWIRNPSRYSRWWLRSANVTYIAVGITTMVALPVATSFFIPADWLLGLVGVILAAGGLLSLIFSERLETSRAMATITVSSALFLTALFGFAAMRVDRYQNAPVIMREIRKAGADQPDLAAYRFFRESLVFYAGRAVPFCRTDDKLAQFLEHAKAPYVLTTDDHEQEILERFPGKFTVLMRRPRFLRSGEVVVLAGRSPHQPASTARESSRQATRR